MKLKSPTGDSIVSLRCTEILQDARPLLELNGKEGDMPKCSECGQRVAKSRLSICPNCNEFKNCEECAEQHEKVCGGRCWRIRVKLDVTHDYSCDAWERNEAGVWYGAFTALDLTESSERSPNDPLAYLNNLPKQRALSWKVKKSHLDTVLRMREIPTADWVMLFLRETQTIGIARLGGSMTSSESHPLNGNGETFKFRTLLNKREFKLCDLPDVYRLLSSQGQSNVFVLKATWRLVQMLLVTQTAAEVKERLRGLPFDELLDFLGPTCWESLCFAYLIFEEDFVPTGLSIGRTLPTVDIVGRRKCDGRRVIAQCKKDNQKRKIEDEFREACKADNTIAYYFAYGGCRGGVPDSVRVIDSEEAIRWFSTPNGLRFKELLLGD